MSDYWQVAGFFGVGWGFLMFFLGLEYSGDRAYDRSEAKHSARVFIAALFIGPIAAVAWPLTLALVALAIIGSLIMFIINVVRDALKGS